jgi:KDO2-lipid IV(A) lauroyltransferase
MKRVFWTVQAALFYVFTLVVSEVPERFVTHAGRLTGLLMLRLLSGRRRIAIDNIRHALPFMTHHPAWSCSLDTPEAISRETFIHLGTSLVETCRLYHGKGNSLIDAIEVRGREHYDRARAKHKGIVFVTGHCGNWELIALCFKRLFNETMSVVARKQNNPYLNTMVERMRMHYDNSIIYKQGALRPIISRLKKDGVIGMLADQAVFTEEGVLIDVLGRKAWASKTPVVIAQKTGVPLIPAFIHREHDRHVITLSPEFELSGDMSEEGIRQDVQALSCYLEDFVCAHPSDWYWVHRRWKRAGEAVE